MKWENMNANWLRQTYFFGIPMTDSNGNPISDDVIEFYIKKAIYELEDALHIKILPQKVIERKDFRQEAWKNFNSIRLNHTPIRKINSIKMRAATLEWVELPLDWVVIQDPLNGIISIVPVLGQLTGVKVSTITAFLLPVLHGGVWFPSIWEVEYECGFDDIPEDIADAVGMIASIQLFNIFGDLVIGAGIANISMGLDGLSLSVGTTASAENAAYSARIREYERQLEKMTMPALKTRYKKLSFVII